MPRLPLLLLPLLSLSAPVLAQIQPLQKSVALPVWTPQFEDDAPGARWSFRAVSQAVSSGEARLLFGWRDAKNYAALRVLPREISLWRVQNGASRLLASAPLVPNGELTNQKIGARVRVLQGGKIVLEASLPGADGQAAWLQKGGMNFQTGAIQPTENPLFRDDFMRAQGPDDKEVPGEWQVVGLWKTSGTLGPKSDAALNPNPFVFRANGPKSSARAGKWWWSDYALSVAFKAQQNEEDAPLLARLGAYGERVRAEFDFQKNQARLLVGEKIVARRPLDAEPGSWHRARLEPGPGLARVWLDGREILSAPSPFAQGEISLGAVASGASFVDFDDVRVGKAGGQNFGEGAFDDALPARFKTDRLIQFWANDARSWKRGENGIYTHAGDFWGAARVSFPLPRWENGAGLSVERGAQKLALTQGETGLSAQIGARKTTFGAKPGEILTAIFDGPKISLQRAGKTVFEGETRGAAGTKIGVAPTRGGVPLPPPILQPISLESATIERDGRAVIGVNITPVTGEIQKQNGLPDASGAIIDNVEPDSPALAAGVKVGDVIRGVGGARVLDVETMRSAVGAVKPGQTVKLEILRPQSDGSGLDWASARAQTSNVLDYAFTTAPTDWTPTRGVWEVAERWTCSPQWSFFAGKNDVAPALWSRFATRGDFTLEAFLATPMDLTRGERSPSDLNVTLGGDGANLGSGLSFIFAGKNRTVNQVRRDGKILWEKPFEPVAGAGDTHQDWFYIRVEKRGQSFKWSVNGREMTKIADPAFKNGQIALWSQNGGLSVARVRLWHAGVEAAPVQKPIFDAPQNQIANALEDFYSPRGNGRNASAKITLATLETGAKSKPIQITNPQSGGDWTAFLSRRAFNPAQKRVLSFDYQMGPDVKINLYALVNGGWREVRWSGPGSPGNGEQLLGEVPASADGKWHRARFDLNEMLSRAGLSGQNIEALALAAPDFEYLRAGLGGNARGATYLLRDLKVE